MSRIYYNTFAFFSKFCQTNWIKKKILHNRTFFSIQEFLNLLKNSFVSSF